MSEQSSITKEELKEELSSLRLEMKAEIKILREEMNERFDNIPSREDFHQLLKSVDGLTKQVKTYNEERSAEVHQLSTITSWAKKVGDKVGIPIEL